MVKTYSLLAVKPYTLFHFSEGDVPTPALKNGENNDNSPVIPASTPKPFYKEMVNIDVIKALVEKANAAHELTFKDIPKDSLTAKTIELATKLGIIRWYADGSFKANAKVTRADFATMIVKALGLTPQDDSSFKDTQDHWAVWVVWAA